MILQGSVVAAVAPLDLANTVVDPRAYADPPRLHAAFRELRARWPVARAEAPGFDPFWLITRHADILEVSRQNEVFHNGDLGVILSSQDELRFVKAITGGSPNLVRTLVNMDAPDHLKHRALTQAWFMPQNVRRLEGRIRAIARASVERMMAAGGRCDFVADVALGYPLHVIMEILGLPEEDEPRMLKLTQEFFGSKDPDLNRGAAEAVDPEVLVGQVKAVFDDFFTYFRAVSEDRRARPREDLASAIATGEVDGRPISDFDAMSYYFLVATAGHDTTSSSTAGAIWALAENPEQFDRVCRDPSLIPGLVDEAIRWTTPVKHFMRSATRDYELRGQIIKEGDWLMLCYLSGNRDEEVFEDPFSFRVDRSPNRHLAFGYGAHLCLGQHLAKMEMRILFEELLPRLQRLELDGEARLSAANFVSGPKRLPIRFKAAGELVA